MNSGTSLRTDRSITFAPSFRIAPTPRSFCSTRLADQRLHAPLVEQEIEIEVHRLDEHARAPQLRLEREADLGAVHVSHAQRHEQPRDLVLAGEQRVTGGAAIGAARLAERDPAAELGDGRGRRDRGTPTRPASGTAPSRPPRPTDVLRADGYRRARVQAEIPQSPGSTGVTSSARLNEGARSRKQRQ